jgi:anti-sigma-K factor RskA
VDVHELTAAYALDALDADETEAYESHLAQCERCREELSSLRESAGALAWAADAPAPPAHLRASILDAAAAERVNVVPLPARRPWAFRAVAAVAAVAVCTAIGLGVWNARLHSQRAPLSAVVVIGKDGHATLSVAGLSRAPRGKVYEAWVIPRGVSPRPAGLFSAAGTIRLRRPVPPNATVAITLERAGGTTAPTREPLITARA